MPASAAASVITGGSLSYLGFRQSDDELFDILLIKSPLVLIAWALLALSPRSYHKYTIPVVKAIGLAFAVLYVLLLADGFVNPVDYKKLTGGKYSSPFDTFYSLEGIHTLFSQKQACFGGWVHYVVFDLWAGIYVATNAAEVGFPQIMTGPILALTMMLGPTGLLLYAVLSAIFTAIFGSPKAAAKKD